MAKPENNVKNRHVRLSIASGLQLLAALWAALNALVATEMSVLLAFGIGIYSVTVGAAAVFLDKGRRWAWRVSLALALAVILLGVVLIVIVDEAPALGLAHGVAGAALLFCLWTGRAAVRC
jgi:FtsH-binding integral membrane protein